MRPVSHQKPLHFFVFKYVLVPFQVYFLVSEIIEKIDFTVVGDAPSSSSPIKIINIQIFVPVKSGSALARQYADKFCSIFDSVIFETVVCDTSSVTIVGSDTKWYQINVDTPYWRDSL